MARSALNWGVRDLAEKADLSTKTLNRLETELGFQSTSLKKVKNALEAAGIEFLPDNGVRLRPKKEDRGIVDA